MKSKAILIGNLGRDPEIKYTTSGTAVCNFSLATTESMKGNKRTDWHNIVCFGKLAEIAAQYLKKGSRIYLEGRIHYDNYENKEGKKIYTTQILCDQLLMLDRGTRKDSDDSDASPSDYEASNTTPTEDGDIPF